MRKRYEEMEHRGERRPDDDAGPFEDEREAAWARESGRFEDAYEDRAPAPPYGDEGYRAGYGIRADREPYGSRAFDPRHAVPRADVRTPSHPFAAMRDRVEARFGHGPHVGRGPKGYKRADERIREDIIERIIDNGIDASDVEIDVKDGEVTLGGHVHQRLYKHRIEDIAASVSGVLDVHNRVRVRKAGEESDWEQVEVMSDPALSPRRRPTTGSNAQAPSPPVDDVAPRT